MAYTKKDESGIPPAPVPSLVRMSMVPEPPPPIPKDGILNEEDVKLMDSGVEVDKTITSGPESAVEFIPLKVGEEEAKGTIVIRVFENSPYETDFEGSITGVEVDMAWKAMMKGYRLWKNRVFKQLDERNKERDNG